MTVEEARRSSPPATPRPSAASTAIRPGRDQPAQHVRMARSIGRPLRYFIAKRATGPSSSPPTASTPSTDYLKAEGLADQFHPSYTRMVPAHHVTEVALVGCPDPNPTYTRFFDAAPQRPAGRPRRHRPAYIRRPERRDRQVAAAARDRRARSASASPAASTAARSSSWPITPCCSLGMNPARLKAFTLAVDGGGDDLDQARRFLDAARPGLFLEPIEVRARRVDWREARPRRRGLQAARHPVGGHGPGPVPRHPAALSRMALPARRRRRRREPQGLPHRGEPRIDDPQRPQQPDAVPGRLGRRRDQALADLLRRPEPRLRPHLRPGRRLRVRRLQPLHAARTSSRSPRRSRSSS